MIPARWAVAAPPDPGLTTTLAADLHIPEPLAAILVQRGLAAPELARAFLRPELERLSDPLALADMARAVAERERAATRVGAGLLARYERIRRGKAPLALYPLHADACGHCFTAVPTQRRALIQRGASIEGCEACGVLLYARE